MLFVKYRHVCIVFLKQVWSSIHRALAVVTWRSRVGSNVALAPQDTGPAAAVSPDPTAAEHNLALIAAHLEYLGYQIRLDPEGWSHAQHSYRYDFHIRSFPQGIRLHCSVGIGAAIGNSRVAWLEFLNDANERGHIAQFSLFEDSMGRHVVRITAFLIAAYSRPAFAMAMDMWHDDLDLVRRKPEFDQQSDAEERADVAVTVN
jgi:hypothetical protein